MSRSGPRPQRVPGGVRPSGPRKLEAKKGQEAPPLPLHAIAIERVSPEVDCGRYAVKRVVGDTFQVWADIFRYGRDRVSASVKHRKRGSEAWLEVPMRPVDNDRWTGSFVLDGLGTYEYTVEAWTDTFTTTVEALEKWAAAGEDVSVDVRGLEGQIEEAVQRAVGEHRQELSSFHKALREGDGSWAVQVKSPRLSELMATYAPKRDHVVHRVLRVVVDREEARYATWYEMFPRSQGAIPERGATFRDCEWRLPEIQRMGFDVVYLPPIHPIGKTNRRGKNNSPDATANDPGSPWAIGSEEGGHDAVNPELGTMSDFQHFVRTAQGLGMEVAIDLALQSSPDHPYVKGHPGWFYHRSDGTIRYAENPPKKYMDIYPLRFEGEERRELWEEILRLVLFWVDKGVRTFRVDNPHTKPPGFWEWLIGQAKERHPDLIFLAEAFTRPKLMKLLAKCGFDQSYTYFTWKNTQRELREFLEEFVTSETSEYFTGNFFTNTPDILSAYLQHGGRNAFKVRLVLAATLSSVYGIYSGFELCENTAVEEGSEEYLDSEKYQYKVWDWDRPGNIKDFVAKVNEIRRTNLALKMTRNLRLLQSTNENIFFYGKWTEDRSNVVLVAVNLDPFRTQQGMVTIPLRELGLDPTRPYQVLDLVTRNEFDWRGDVNFVKLDPNHEPAHILQLQPQPGTSAPGP